MFALGLLGSFDLFRRFLFVCHLLAIHDVLRLVLSRLPITVDKLVVHP